MEDSKSKFTPGNILMSDSTGAVTRHFIYVTLLDLETCSL